MQTVIATLLVCLCASVIGERSVYAAPLSERILLSKASADEDLPLVAEGRGYPWVNIKNGFTSAVSIDGGGAHRLGVGSGALIPQAIVGGDFNGDGIADVVQTFISSTGGWLVYRGGSPGLRFSIQPQGIKQDIEPFAAQASVMASPVIPDHIAAGDFNADGVLDLVVAAAHANQVYWLYGDGTGHFEFGASYRVAGNVTALTTGGLHAEQPQSSLAVGVLQEDNARVHVFAPFTKEPAKTIAVPTMVQELAMGRFNADPWNDLGILAGTDLLVVAGGKSWREMAWTSTTMRFPEKLVALGTGDFVGDAKPDLALLSARGSLFLIEPTTGSVRDASLPFDGENVGLVAAQVSSFSKADLVIRDAERKQIAILHEQHFQAFDERSALLSDQRNLPQSVLSPVVFDVADRPLAVLPMRLNGDALKDLVVLTETSTSEGRSEALTVALTAPVNTFVVNTTSDEGDADPDDGQCRAFAGQGCTLSAALTEASVQPGADLITFSIDRGVQLIQSNFAFQGVIEEAVTLDGTTQGGYDGIPLIQLHGDFSIQASNTIIRGLNINSRNGAIAISSGTNSSIEQNYIGLNEDGDAMDFDAGTSAFGILVGSSGNTIGGEHWSAGNVIAGIVDGDGIVLSGLEANDNVVAFNYIGTDKDGQNVLGQTLRGVDINIGASRNTIRSNVIAGHTLAGIRVFGLEGIGAPQANTIIGNVIGLAADTTTVRGNRFGIYMEHTTGNTIGGAASGEGNIIAGNELSGININGRSGDTSGNRIIGNWIGTNPALAEGLGNGTAGIVVVGADNNAIGGTGVDEPNTIIYNGGDGVYVESGVRNAIRQNAIYENGGLGIDLGVNGVRANDERDMDGGANTQLNYPVLTVPSAREVAGNYEGQPNATFTVELFQSEACDPTDYGEGAEFLVAVTITTDDDGNAEFSVEPGHDGERFITATVIDAVGNTSEFSKCAGTPKLVVNAIGDLPDNDLDDPACDTGGTVFRNGEEEPECTLRAALQQANHNADGDEIAFDIVGTAPYIIAPTSALPAIVGDVFLDATTQPGYSGRPIVQLFGGMAGAGANGLHLAGGISTVRGLSIYGFEANGILIQAAGNAIRANFIGTNEGGTSTGEGNQANGILIDNVPSNVIGGRSEVQRNLISANAQSGVRIQGQQAQGNTLQHNYIGVDGGGSNAIPNGQHGIYLVDAPKNRLEGPNLVSGNATDGVRIEGAGAVENEIMDTIVGLDATGQRTLPNGQHGIHLLNASENRIGVPDFERNVISGNGASGIRIEGPSAEGNRIQNNRIGTNLSGVLVLDVDGEPLGNQAHGIHLHNTVDTQIGEDLPIVHAATGAFPQADPRLVNLVRGNLENGIAITGEEATFNIIRGNQVYDNGALSIDIDADGVTPNDLADGMPAKIDQDEGANARLNFPVGITASEDIRDKTRWVISGVLPHNAPHLTFVDLYTSQAANENDFGFGQEHLGGVRPDTSGVFQMRIPKDKLTWPLISGVTTDDLGNTSEFSPVCTDPDGNGNVDNDGDGLCDVWELKGIDYDGDGTVDLALHKAPFEAKPNKMDLFIEADYMEAARHSHKPVKGATADVEAVFAKAPVDNPDQTTGIRLKIMVDEAVREVEPLAFGPFKHEKFPRGKFDDLKLGLLGTRPCQTGQFDGHVGTQDDRKAPNCASIIGARNLVFRYLIFGHNQSHTIGSGGMGELPGNDFIVTLGQWSDESLLTGAGFGQNARGRVQDARRHVEAAVLMHELGHTLNLRHGGLDDVNYKPNFISVMNYTFQDRRFISDREMDYSREALPTLDEQFLRETQGIGGDRPTRTAYHDGSFEAAKVAINAPTVDWNGNRRIDNNVIDWDINFLNPEDGPSPNEVLFGHDDWANIQLNFRGAPDFAEGSRHIADSLTFERTDQDVLDDATRMDYDDDGLNNAIDNCPGVANPDQADVDGDGQGDVCEGSIADLALLLREQTQNPLVNQALIYGLTLFNLGPDSTASPSLIGQLDSRSSEVELATDDGECFINVTEIICSFDGIAVGDSANVNVSLASAELGALLHNLELTSDEVDPDTTNNQLDIETAITSGVAVESAELPRVAALYQNYPNPFTGQTTIRFDVAQPAYVELRVYDVLGREVQQLISRPLVPGAYEEVFDASHLVPGVYFYHVQIGAYQATQKMTVLR